ncbi:MAG: hypothetical protein GYA21_07820 [Myxococcales bacterium]|nr:hypothetical protein [Myxococcales bacterium]
MNIRRIIYLGLFPLLLVGCSESVDLSINLVNPCDRVVLGQIGCQYVQVVVSSLDPNDPLHPGNTDYGPLRTTCEAGSGQCQINAGDLLGPARVVDVRCMQADQTTVIGRATSGSLLFATQAGGVAGLTLNLVMGPVNGLVNTTVLSQDDSLGDCSALQQSGGRYGHASVVLDDGRVLITGGIRRLGPSVEEILKTAEIFDPATGKHRLLTRSDGTPVLMQSPSGRAFHTATLLRDGRVLLAGGIGMMTEGTSEVKKALQHSEIFDPRTESFTGTAVMGTGRAHHAATMLATGEVLLSGGAAYVSGQVGSYYNTALVYDPVSNTWPEAKRNLPMSTARAFHKAEALDSSSYGGKVIVIGGENETGPVNTIDIYNPQTGGFLGAIACGGGGQPGPCMSKSRSRFCAVRLQDGRIAVAGGITEKNGQPDITMEVYNPVPPTGTSLPGRFESLSSMTVARESPTCSLLDTGNILIAGGLTAGGPTSVVDVVQVFPDSLNAVAGPESLNPPRWMHTANVLRNGWVFLSGGLPSQDAGANALNGSVLFVPPPSF